MGIAKGLMTHPNFKLPPRPRGYKRDAFLAGVNWGIACAAAAVSPPKVDGEDEEFSCDDLAKFLRNDVTRAALDHVARQE